MFDVFLLYLRKRACFKMIPKKLKRFVGKKESKVKDPPRYPEVINGYENQAKREGVLMINKTLIDLTKAMVKEVKKNA